MGGISVIVYSVRLNRHLIYSYSSTLSAGIFMVLCAFIDPELFPFRHPRWQPPHIISYRLAMLSITIFYVSYTSFLRYTTSSRRDCPFVRYAHARHPPIIHRLIRCLETIGVDCLQLHLTIFFCSRKVNVTICFLSPSTQQTI